MLTKAEIELNNQYQQSLQKDIPGNTQTMPPSLKSELQDLSNQPLSLDEARVVTFPVINTDVVDPDDQYMQPGCDFDPRNPFIYGSR
jgi:hypothetical protein